MFDPKDLLKPFLLKKALGRRQLHPTPVLVPEEQQDLWSLGLLFFSDIAQEKDRAFVMTVGNPPAVFANYADVLTWKDSFVLPPRYLLASTL